MSYALLCALAVKLCCALVYAQGVGQVQATAIGLAGDGAHSTISLDLTDGVQAEVYTLANPYRVVVDLPDVAFDAVKQPASRRQSLVRAVRYGFFADHAARVVIDTSGPVRIEKAVMTRTGSSSAAVRLAITLAPMDAAAFGRGTGAARASPPARPSAPAEAGTAPSHTKLVIVVDPGHGGIDPGASGASSLLEKNIVLAVGRQLADALGKTGRYEVHLTRSSDVYVSLGERLALSRRYAADLFISLHADAIEQKEAAQAVRGATVYTLSDKASDKEARLRAERENASDLLAGMAASENEERDEVMSILIDLMKRETAEFSAEFAKTLVARLGKTVSLSHKPQRSAAFMVLRQTDSPSVLIELGYMSHPEDEKLMTTTGWQSAVAASIAAAVDTYFAKRTARVP